MNRYDKSARVLSDKGKPVCIRVFVNDDDTQHSVEIVDVWGRNAPPIATTTVDTPRYDQCDKCGSDQYHTTSERTRWILCEVQDLDYTNGLVAYYWRDL